MNAAPFTGGRTLMIRAAAVGVMGLAATAAGGALDARRALYAYLAAFVYWVGIAAAAMVFLMANEAADSKWYIVVRRLLETLTTALHRAGRALRPHRARAGPASSPGSTPWPPPTRPSSPGRTGRGSSPSTSGSTATPG